MPLARFPCGLRRPTGVVIIYIDINLNSIDEYLRAAIEFWCTTLEGEEPAITLCLTL
jgi:hypothetical protein